MAESRVEATYSKDEFLQFLKAVDQEINKKVKVILIGGAAAILAFGNNRSSMDIDTYNKIDDLDQAIKKARKKTGLRIAFSRSSVVFAPIHFEERLYAYNQGHFKNLDVYVPEVHDFAMMKISRLIERDLADIVEIHNRRQLSAETLFKLYRNEMKHYAGDETLLRDRYLATIETLFGTKTYKSHLAKLKVR